MNSVLKELLKEGYLIEPAAADIINKHLSKIPLSRLLAQLNAPKFLSQKFFLANAIKLKQLLINSNTDKDVATEAISALVELEGPKEEQKEEEKEEEEPEIIKRKNITVLDYKFSAKKISVDDFSQYFRERFTTLKPFIQDHKLEGLTSINKIPNMRVKHTISVIGIVSSIRLTKNKNLLIELEDLTGKIAILVNKDKEDLFKKSQEIVLDEVIGITGNGSREIIFVNNVVFPEIALLKEKRSPHENYAAFIADTHIGSNNFLEEKFLKFIDWLNGKTGSEKQKELSKKVKYLFIAGDVVDGTGAYPGHEKWLVIKDIYKQHQKLAEFLKKIRKDITIFVCPGGGHDAVRLLEPQPPIPKDIAPELYELKNVVLVTNPSKITIEQYGKFDGIDVLMYHGDSFDYYAEVVDVLRQNNAKLKIEMITQFLLKKRHLAPTYTSTPLIPLKNDPLLIRSAPDILVSGHMHKSSVSKYNGITTIACSCWQVKTPYQEKFGHEPDPCKVPLLNLKTGKANILDFS